MLRQHEKCDRSATNEFLTDQLSASEQQAFEEHLERCPPCRQELAAMAAERELWDEVQETLGSNASLGVLHAGPSGCPPSHDEDMSPPRDGILALLKPTDHPNMLGRFGGYEIAGIIGHGGMGVVLKGFDAALNRFVAIKVLAPHLATSGSARRRFSREAQAAAAVVHDNVIAIHSVSDDKGHPYVVMPYERGRSLQKRLDESGPLNVVEVLRVGMQAAAGLAAAHAQGLVHRDIKPANILLDEGVERVKLTDFGLARAADDASLTKTGVIAGTPQYMSPEQARGESVDHRSDLFSLGSILYTMCTGRLPFRAETSYGVLRRITDQEPRPIREINPNIPQWLCQIIAKLMSKQLDDRFESAGEVAELLEECLAHVQQPTAVQLPTLCFSLREKSPLSPERTTTGFRRSWVSLLLTAACAAAVIVAGIVIRIKRDNKPDTIVEVAEGSKVEIGADGAVEVKLPNQTNAQRAPSATGNDPLGVGGLPAVSRGLGMPLDANKQYATGQNASIAPVPRLKQEPWKVVRFNGSVSSVEYSHDGNHVAVAAGSNIYVLDTKTGEQKVSITQHQARVWRVTYSPDGRLLASASQDRTVRFWDADTGKPVGRTREYPADMRWLMFSPDGRSLITAPDERDNHRIDFCTVTDGEVTRTIRGAGSTIYELAISPQGRLLASAESGGHLNVWDVESRNIRWTGEHRGGVITVQFSPTGDRLASGGWDGRLRIWNARDGKRLKDIKASGDMDTLQWWPDSRVLLFGMRNGTFGNLDVDSGQIVQQFKAHDGAIFDLALSPDARRVISGGSEDNRLKFWDVVSATTVANPDGNRASIRGIATDQPSTPRIDDRVQTLRDVVRQIPSGKAKGSIRESPTLHRKEDGIAREKHSLRLENKELRPLYMDAVRRVWSAAEERRRLLCSFSVSAVGSTRDNEKETQESWDGKLLIDGERIRSERNWAGDKQRKVVVIRNEQFDTIWDSTDRKVTPMVRKTLPSSATIYRRRRENATRDPFVPDPRDLAIPWFYNEPKITVTLAMIGSVSCLRLEEIRSTPGQRHRVVNFVDPQRDAILLRREVHRIDSRQWTVSEFDWKLDDRLGCQVLTKYTMTRYDEGPAVVWREEIEYRDYTAKEFSESPFDVNELGDRNAGARESDRSQSVAAGTTGDAAMRRHRRIAASQDGALIADLRYDIVVIVDARSRSKVIKTIKIGGVGESVAFSRDGREVGVVTNEGVGYFDVRNGKLLRFATREQWPEWPAAKHQSGPIAKIAANAPVSSREVVVSKDGELVAYLSRHAVEVLDTETKEFVMLINLEIDGKSILFSADGREVGVVAKDGVRYYGVRSGKLLRFAPDARWPTWQVDQHTEKQATQTPREEGKER